MKRRVIWNDNSGYVEPKVIISAVIALIFIVVTFICIGMIGQVGEEFNPRYSGSFDVIDHSVDLDCQTNERNLDNVVVTIFYSDGTSVMIYPPDYFYSGSVVTVDQDVL